MLFPPCWQTSQHASGAGSVHSRWHLIFWRFCSTSSAPNYGLYVNTPTCHVHTWDLICFLIRSKPILSKCWLSWDASCWVPQCKQTVKQTLCAAADTTGVQIRLSSNDVWGEVVNMNETTGVYWDGGAAETCQFAGCKTGTRGILTI